MEHADFVTLQSSGRFLISVPSLLHFGGTRLIRLHSTQESGEALERAGEVTRITMICSASETAIP